MKTEFEIRILEISIEDIVKKLKKIGAQKVGEFHQKRYVYDFNPVQKGRWIRLRTNGIESTLTIKEIKSLRIDGTKELEISVSNFEDTNEILAKLGYTPRTYQENFRIEYTLDGVNFDLDQWPMISPYLEIEGPSEESVLLSLSKLGIDISNTTALDVDTIYYKKYDIVLDKIKDLRFNDTEQKMIQEYHKLTI